MATEIQRLFQAKIDQREALLTKRLSEAQQAVRHKCFVSYHHADQVEAEAFV